MHATTKTFHGIKVGSPTLVAQGKKTSIILTQHDYKHHGVGSPRSSSTDPSRRLREPSEAPSLSLQCMEPPRRVCGGALQASRRVTDSLNNDKSFFVVV